MKRLLFLLLPAAAILTPLAAEPSAEQTDARRAALELAGAFGNDGFALRDGHICGDLKPGTAYLVQVNLYAGNEYWISAATTGKAKKLTITLCDETGAPVETEKFEDGARAAAGFAPAASGPFYVKIEIAEGAADAFCLVYSYK